MGHIQDNHHFLPFFLFLISPKGRRYHILLPALRTSQLIHPDNQASSQSICWAEIHFIFLFPQNEETFPINFWLFFVSWSMMMSGLNFLKVYLTEELFLWLPRPFNIPWYNLHFERWEEIQSIAFLAPGSLSMSCSLWLILSNLNLSVINLGLLVYTSTSCIYLLQLDHVEIPFHQHSPKSLGLRESILDRIAIEKSFFQQVLYSESTLL